MDEVEVASNVEVLRLKFHHGLGDTLMFRSVLELLDARIELYLHPLLGQGAVFHGVEGIEVVDEPAADLEFRTVRFAMENSRPCAGGNSTKARVCMEHEFGLIRPDFRIRPMPLDNLKAIESPAIDRTREFLSDVDRYVVCHFQGTWCPEVQNTEAAFARRTVEALVARGFAVVLVNYDYVFHNPRNADFDFIDGHRVRSTFRALPMEFESLWYLLRGAEMFVGVDSGPLHAAVCLDIPCVYLRKGTDFVHDFYDEGLEDLLVVDTEVEGAVPEEVLDQVLGARRSPPVSSAPRIPRTPRSQAEFLLGLYRQHSLEHVETGVLHDAGRIGKRGLVYRTDAEVAFGLVRMWRPDLVIDFCTGLGDLLSYVLFALNRNQFGLCLSADLADRALVCEWLNGNGIPTERLLLCDSRDIRTLLPSVSSALRHKRRILWLLDTNHEYEMGQWQLENIIKPYRHKCVFAKDDIVAVDNRLESDMGAVYAIRDFVCANMEVVSTNAAFGSVSGLPCGEQPYRGAEGRATPGAIPFRACSRNDDIQARIRLCYPRWDGSANKMVFFWDPRVMSWDSVAGTVRG